MTYILRRQLRSTLPFAVSGRGIVINDAEGREYLDASDGAACGIHRVAARSNRPVCLSWRPLRLNREL